MADMRKARYVRSNLRPALSQGRCFSQQTKGLPEFSQVFFRLRFSPSVQGKTANFDEIRLRLGLSGNLTWQWVGLMIFRNVDNAIGDALSQHFHEFGETIKAIILLANVIHLDS